MIEYYPQSHSRYNGPYLDPNERFELQIAPELERYGVREMIFFMGHLIVEDREGVAVLARNSDVFHYLYIKTSSIPYRNDEEIRKKIFDIWNCVKRRYLFIEPLMFQLRKSNDKRY